MSVQSEEFLAHIGVKGMKWGKRKARDDSGGSNQGEKPKRQPMSRNKKIAIGVGVGLVAAVGTAVVLKSMNKNMKLPISALRNNPSTSAGREIFTASVPKVPTSSGTGLSLGSATRFAGKSVPAPTGRTASSVGRAASSVSRSSASSGPSLSSLNNIINSAPKIVFDSATGQYVTR